MKSPFIMPTYLCGECGAEMLVDHAYSHETRARTGSVMVRCYTPRCAQKGQSVAVLLEPATTMQTEEPTRAA